MPNSTSEITKDTIGIQTEKNDHPKDIASGTNKETSNKEHMDHLRYMLAPPIVFEIGDGKALNQLRDSIPEPCPILGSSYPMFIVVTEKDFEIAMNNGEIGDSLQDDRLYWFIGDTRWDELSNFIIKRPWIAPSFTYIGLGTNAPAMTTAVKRVQGREQAICQPTENMIEAIPYPTSIGESPRFISNKKKIAAIAPRQSTVLGYAMRNVADALRRQQYDVEIIEEASPRDRLTEEWIIHRLNEIRPTHILNIYRPLTFKHEGSRCITWIQDPASFEGKVQEGDVIAPIMGGEFLKTYRDSVDHDDQLKIIPMAANPEQYPLLNRLRPTFDISFVTNVDSQFNEVGFALINAALKHFEKWGGSDTTSFDRAKSMYIVKKVRLIKPASRSRACQYYSWECERIAQRVYWMLKIVKMVEEKGLRLGLFGRGWELMPEFKKYARGKLKGPKMVNAVFRSTRVNLHMNSNTNMHQRLLEAGCSGTHIAFPKIKHDENLAEGGILNYFSDQLLNRFDEKDMEEVLTREQDPNQRSIFRADILANDTYDVRARQMLDAIS